MIKTCLAVWFCLSVQARVFATGRSFCFCAAAHADKRGLSVQTRHQEKSAKEGDFVFGSDSAVITNRYFPLTVVSTYTYKGIGCFSGKTIVFKVVAVEEADGVQCVKVRYTDPYGTSEEWYAQDLAGNVWRLRQHNISCIYPVDEYDEDDYLEMPSDPQIGEVYEIWVDEDMVISVTEQVSVPANTYSDCLELTCVDDDIDDDFEYYAPGVGLIGEYDGYCGMELQSFATASPALLSQKIAFPVQPVKVLGDEDFDPGATASSGLAITYASSSESVAVIADGLVHIVGAGTTRLTASQSGSGAYSAAKSVSQILMVKARVTADVIGGGGSVGGAGLYLPGAKVSLKAKPQTGYAFLSWEDGAQSAARTLVMPETNITVSARFGLISELPPPVVADPGAYTGMVGVACRLPLRVTSESLAAVSVRGVPSGLKYQAGSQSIAGIPSKAGTFVVTVSAKNAHATAARTFTLFVEPLPAWARGSFNGAAGMGDLGNGTATLSVSALGKVSGKIALAGSNYAFSAASYQARDEAGALWLTATAKVARVILPLSVSVVACSPTNAAGGALATLGEMRGLLGEGGWLSLYQNVWKSGGLNTFALGYAGKYTVPLAGWNGLTGGALSFVVDKSGNVKTTGTLADGAALSAAGPLVLDGDGRVWTVVYAVPKAYKGKWILFAIAEFVKAGDGSVSVVLLDGDASLW